MVLNQAKVKPAAEKLLLKRLDTHKVNNQQ